ncbi:MAG: 50S ribosomal protein L18 [Kiritimatiellae bacterium]|nr:50S ribosomal protein L18 [Kiritimatiellia bacterium]MCO5060924.1 50S ribosomal protein L18 [Kiritimatiellia bacterium]MCO6400819.1 50S ribosomal protein L18 [Verrucomicrobiota bacterium]
MRVVTKKDYRKRRHVRLRQRMAGTATRPRMSVFVSNKHFYIQFIDDAASSTLAQVSTQNEAFGDSVRNNLETARKLGELAARVAADKGITEVVFDRGGFAYGGRVKVLAEAAREAGLKF